MNEVQKSGVMAYKYISFVLNELKAKKLKTQALQKKLVQLMSSASN